MADFQSLTISLPKKLAREIRSGMQVEELTQSELVRSALRSYLLERRLRNLQEYGAGQAKKAGINVEDVDKLIHGYRAK